MTLKLNSRGYIPAVLLALCVAMPAVAQAAADLGVTLALRPVSAPFAVSTLVGYGQVRTFRATVTWNGPDAVANSSISVVVPSAWSYTSSPTGQDFSCSDPDATTQAVTCTAQLGPQGVSFDQSTSPTTVDIRLTLRTPAAAARPTTCPDGTTALPAITVSVASAGNTDPVPANDSATVGGMTLRPFTDLALTFRAAATGAEGQTITYSGTVANHGPCPVAGPVRVAITKGVTTYVAGSSTGCDGGTAVAPSTDTYDATNNRCTIAGPLPADGTAKAFTLGFTLPAGIITSDTIQTTIPVVAALSDRSPDTATNMLAAEIASGNNTVTARTTIDGKASGGCSSSGASLGLLALLGLLVVPLFRRRPAAALALALLPVLSLAQAQEAAPASQPEGEKKAVVEEITVTGTRVRRKDLTTPAPVTVLSREQVVASGKANIADFLQSLPEQGNAINTSVNNGGDGATRVSLRGLGTQRTLVLVNGRRFVPGGTGADGSVDLNSIPTAAVERIEILKDGASAVYGSDALGGVVNIITRRGWSGAEVAGYGGISSRGDGAFGDVNATFGQTGDSGSVLFSAGFSNQSKVMAGDRTFSKQQRFWDAFHGKQVSNGSSANPNGLVWAGGTADAGTLYDQLATLYPNADAYQRDPAAGPANTVAGWRDWRGGALPADGGDGYNFQPENYLITPQQKISLYASGDTRLGSIARGYFEASYVNRQSGQDLAPEPLFTDSEGLTVSRWNQYNPMGMDIDPVTGVARRLVEFGRRRYRQDLDTFRVVGGLDGTLPDVAGPLQGWFWDLSLNYGRTQGTQTKQGNLLRPNLASAIGPSQNGVCYQSYDPATATYSGPIADCVPINLFGGAGTITPAQVAGLTFTGTLRGTNQLAAFQANTSGELFRLLSDRPVGLALGYEHRFLSGAFIPDPITVQGWTTGNKGKITQGAYTVNEGYAELAIPVISGQQLVDDLELTAAARVFHYSNFGSDNTYKFGGKYRPIRDFTLRGTYSTAFRAPSISDLYAGQSDNFANVTDPCANAATAPAACGAAAGNNDPKTQLRSQVGGNPDLKPETAKIFTVGAVFEPSFVKNFSATVDFYDVKIEKTISTIGESVILNGCYSGQSPEYCQYISRNPVSQKVTNIINLNQNVGSEKMRGFDVALRYAYPTPFGKFTGIFDGTYLLNYDVTLANGKVIKVKQNFDYGTTGSVYPAFKFNAGVLWALKSFGAGVSTRFLGSIKECTSQSGLFSGSGLCYQDEGSSRRVGNYATFDAFASYDLASTLGKTNVAVGMNNLFDTQPRYIYNGFTGASDPTAYDFMGRYMYVRVAHRY